ncbi:hypothetical protein ACFV2X_38415 [Streptomyces sp. NPDC059679]|uniref:hypothetical protein n=1 Tax=Streptomyces sp. NPDC059679 TaxID=3346903 RepID=UPI00368040CC
MAAQQGSDHPRWCTRDYCTADSPNGEHASVCIELTKDLDARVAQYPAASEPHLVLMYDAGYETSVPWSAVGELVRLVKAAN